MGKWTKAELNRLRQLMTTQGRDIDQIADEIRHLCCCSKLAAYRMAHSWSQPEAAQRYQQATGGYMDQPLLSKLEQFPLAASRPPLAAQLIGFATVYGTTPLRLVGPYTLERLDPHERNVLIRCDVAFTPTPQPGEALQGIPVAWSAARPRTAPVLAGCASPKTPSKRKDRW